MCSVIQGITIVGIVLIALLALVLYAECLEMIHIRQEKAAKDYYASLGPNQRKTIAHGWMLKCAKIGEKSCFWVYVHDSRKEATNV